MPMTWKDVAGATTGASAMLINQGANNMQNAMQGFADMAEQGRQQNITNQNRLEADNTDAILARIDALGSMDAYESAIASGDFSADALKSEFGEGNFDVRKVLGHFAQKDNKLMQDESDTYNYETARTARADKPILDGANAELYGLSDSADITKFMDGIDGLQMSEGAKTKLKKDAKAHSLQLQNESWNNLQRSWTKRDQQWTEDDRAERKAKEQKDKDIKNFVNSALGKYEGSPDKMFEGLLTDLSQGKLGKDLTYTDMISYIEPAIQAQGALFGIKPEQQAAIDQQTQYNQENIQTVQNQQKAINNGLNQELGFPVDIFKLSENKDITEQDVANKFSEFEDSGWGYKDAALRIRKKLKTATPAEIDYILTQAAQGDYSWFNSNQYELVSSKIDSVTDNYSKTIRNNAKRSDMLDHLKQQERELADVQGKGLSAIANLTSAARSNNVKKRNKEDYTPILARSVGTEYIKTPQSQAQQLESLLTKFGFKKEEDDVNKKSVISSLR